MPIAVSAEFDAGNIELVSIDTANTVRLNIRSDNQSEFLQWFYFRVTGARNVACQFVIENASQTSYPAGWENFDVVTSHDLIHWYRTPSQYDQQSLSWSLTPEHDVMYFAYFAPYSLDRLNSLVANCANKPGVRMQSLGATLDGRDLDYLWVGAIDEIRDDEEKNHARKNSSNRPQIWCVARQHPGEAMASWWVEGWLNRLLDYHDATSIALREMADIHIVPNMNPDGSYRGHLRTNACGANLNREWLEPSMERSPEVFLVKQRMAKTGVNLCLDIHGDEALPYNFIAGTEGVSNWNETRDQQLIGFKRTLAALNPDFQTEHGYPRSPPNSANLSFCSNNVAQTYGCPAYTLEMPFKDTANRPSPQAGWSPERSKALGASFVDAVYLAMCDRLL